MTKEPIFELLLFFCLSFHSVVSNAQTSAKQTIPNASVVVLDTIFYTPDKAMPFDRHFTLKLSLPGKFILKGYLVYPIDHYGNRIATRRDYNLYTWSLVKSRAELREIRKKITWVNFKDPKHLGSAIMTDTATYPIGKRTGIELKIPPLDPNRDYHLKIVYTDPKFSNKIDELVLPMVSTLTSNSSFRISTFNQLKATYEKILPDDKVFNSVPFADFLSKYKCNDYLKIDTLFANGIDKFFSDKYRLDVSYKFYFSKNVLIEASAKVLPTQFSLEIKDEDYYPKKSKILAAFLFGSANAAGTKDVDGNPINFNQSAAGTYGIYIAININVVDLKGNKIAEFKDFGKLDDVTFIIGDKDLISWAAFPQQTLKCDETALADLQMIVSTLPKYDCTNSGCLTKESFKILYREAMACPCEDKKIRSVTDVNELISLIALFNSHNEQYIGNAQIGKISLKDPNKIETKDVPIYLSNIKSSLASLDFLMGFSRQILVKLSSQMESKLISDQLVCLEKIRTVLTTNQESLEKILKISSDFRNRQIKSWQYSTVRPITDASTQIVDFMTAAKFKIVPDFGFVVISNSPQRGLVHDLVPYLGFNVNLRCIDKNIPMREVLHKPIRYYFSIVVGVTLTSIKIDQKRDDLFAGKSFMGGFGFRVNNYLKIIGGGVFYKKYSLNPLSDEKNIAVSPFAGLSVDYEISDLLGGINKLFK